MPRQVVNRVASISLRGKNKKRNKTIATATGIALLIHVIAWLYWKPFETISVAQLPDWVNITLVAGFEQQQAVTKPQPEPVVTPAAKPVVKKQLEKPAAKPQHEVTETSGKPPEVTEKEPEPASASTFIEADSRPFALDNPKPVYPSFARRRGMQGVVLLQVSVSETGEVTAIHIMRSSGYRLLDVAALNSVKQWRFMPARQGNENVASSVQVPIRFILNNP